MIWARDFAHRVHAGQVDKAGAPYIEHLSRVASRARLLAEQQGGSDRMIELCEAVGWLHDTIEDTETGPGDLLGAGFSDEVVSLVLTLSRPKGEPYKQFIRAIVDSGSMVAILVKIADVEDNTNPDRPKTCALPHSLLERYACAKVDLWEAVRKGRLW